jgi:phosphatidylglycerol:prolipoprotein diacylglycerol transferase
MLVYADSDPVAFELGPLAVHGYGLRCAIGFLGAWPLSQRQARQPWSRLSRQQVGDLLTWVVVGVIAGGRLGYMLFYQRQALLAAPISLFRLREGGMSLHGGLLGVLIALWLYAQGVKS